MEKFDFSAFLKFNQFITPTLVQVIFWIGVIGSVIGGISSMVGGRVWIGLLTLILGPLFTRIWCELVIVLFQLEKNTRK